MTTFRATYQLPPPCHDAAGCIQSLFEHMEIKITTQVFRKLHKIDKMAGNTAFEYAHGSKAKTSCYLSKIRPMTVKVTDEQNQKLASIFRFYCQLGEKRNYKYMSKQQFLRFTRDACLVSYDIDLIELDLLFTKINTTSASYGDHKLRLSGPEFVVAVVSAAVRLYPEMDQQQAFEQVLEENVLPLLEYVSHDDTIGDILIQDGTLRLVQQYEKTLKNIFQFYCSQDELAGTFTFQDRIAKQSLLSQTSLLKFVVDFDIMPTLLSAMKVTHCFQQTLYGVHGNSKQTNFITFNQFLECMCRIALLAFNFRERDPVSHTVAFSESYSQDAKKLWTDSQNLRKTRPAVPAIETMPLEVRVISPTRRRADTSADARPPFLGNGVRLETLSAQMSEGMLPEDIKTTGTSEWTERPVLSQEDSIGSTEEYNEIQRKVMTMTVTSTGRPASARGATRSRPPSANSRASTLPQAYVVSNVEQVATAHRPTLMQRATFSSDWIGKPKSPMLGQDRSKSLPQFTHRSPNDLYETDGLMADQANAPTIYHDRMHTMVSQRIEREQTIDKMIMAWHLQGREIARANLNQTKKDRVDLMGRSCQLPGSRPRSAGPSKIASPQSTGSPTSRSCGPSSPALSGRRGLKTSHELLVEAVTPKKSWPVSGLGNRSSPPVTR